MKDIFEKAKEEVLKMVEKSSYPPARELPDISQNIFGCDKERKRKIIASDILDVILYTLSFCNIHISGARIRNCLEKVLKQEKQKVALCFLKESCYFEIYNLRKRDFFETKQWLRVKNDIEQYVLWRFKEIKEKIPLKSALLKKSYYTISLFGFAEEYRRYFEDYLKIAFALAERTYQMVIKEVK